MLGVLKNRTLYGDSDGSQDKVTFCDGLIHKLLNLTKPQAMAIFEVGLLLMVEAAFDCLKKKNNIVWREKCR